jgi:hypothetical protein
LSKRAIGDYLGEKYETFKLLFISKNKILSSRDDFHIEVLKHFAHMHDFFSMDIVDALR